jgi:predicted negative regulator of RcsB-dependent stress response
MATLQSDEANIFDQEAFNWRIVVFPILILIVLVIGGLGIYSYRQNQRDELEASARAALVDAKTPEDFLKVADQYPGADQSTLALVSAADAFFAKHDYAGAIGAYQRVTQNSATDPALRDAAQIGLASAQEASGKVDDAITTYLLVAREGAKSPYAPYAYNAVAQIYEQRGDSANERKVLTEAAALDPESSFVKQAQAKLRELTTPPMTVPVPAPAASAPAPSAPAAPSITPPAPAAK